MFKIVIFICGLVLSTVWAKDLRLAIGDELPPYIFKNSERGIEYEIVKEALAFKGHRLIPRYVPLARLLRHVQKDGIDGALTISENFNTRGMFLSDPYITYQNVVVSLAKNKVIINNLSHFKMKNILSFQNSKRYLGDDYSYATDTCRKYSEVNNQENQVAMLLRSRVDAIVIDKNIFLYHYKNSKKIDIHKKAKIHNLFSPSHYRVLFKSEKMRQDFNEGLKELVETGRYSRILSSYTN